MCSQSMRTPETPSFNLEHTLATSSYTRGSFNTPDGSSTQISSISLTRLVIRAQKLSSNPIPARGVPSASKRSAHISRIPPLSVIIFPSTRKALIWDEQRWPFKNFQNNLSSESAAAHNLRFGQIQFHFKKPRNNDLYALRLSRYLSWISPSLGKLFCVQDSKEALEKERAVLTLSGSFTKTDFPRCFFFEQRSWLELLVICLVIWSALRVPGAVRNFFQIKQKWLNVFFVDFLTRIIWPINFWPARLLFRTNTLFVAHVSVFDSHFDRHVIRQIIGVWFKCLCANNKTD